MVMHYTGLSPFPDAVTTEPVSSPAPTPTQTGMKCIHVYGIYSSDIWESWPFIYSIYDLTEALF